MFGDDSFLMTKGVILYREISGESNLWVKLFLHEIGIVNVTARKPTGDTEPLIWGRFSLKKKQKGKNYFIDDTEIVDDMFNIRKKKDTIATAFNWTKLLIKYLAPEQPDDELIVIFYWNMKLLCENIVPPEASNWRFLWQWLKIWGIAPDLKDLLTRMNFNHDEILLLNQIASLNINKVIDLFSKPLNYNIRENAFKIASKIAVKFLDEK
ncbi:MAG: hypothetical protein IJQ47_06025 [Synergistaceae bacterium]|nr:hypothetical protein [Synergistaceae bacterium]